MRRRHASGFADADADARQRQLHEIAGEPADRGHRAPHRRADGDDGDAVGALGGARDRHAEQRVEDGESGPAEQAELESLMPNSAPMASCTMPIRMRSMKLNV